MVAVPFAVVPKVPPVNVVDVTYNSDPAAMLVTPANVEPCRDTFHCAVALEIVLKVVAVVLDGVNVMLDVEAVMANV